MTRNAKILAVPALIAAAVLVAVAAFGGPVQAQVVPVVATDVQCSPSPCVDTSDIVPGAVTGSVIASQTIGPNKLIPGSMNTSVIAADAVRSNKILDGAVQHVDLAADAVFRRIILVRADSANQIANCNALNAALASIAVHDANNPWLIKLEPGIYRCAGSSTSPHVQMLSYVSIEGSGVLSTVIRGVVDSTVNGVLSGAANAELRQVRVENLGGFNNAVAVDDGGGNPRMTDVIAVAGFGPTTSTGIRVTGTPTLTNVVAVGNNTCRNCLDARGIHVVGDGAHPRLVNVTASADGNRFRVGLLNENRVTARNSVFVGDTAAVEGTTAAIEHNLVSTQLDGGIRGLGIFRCVGAYDGLFAALNASCL